MGTNYYTILEVDKSASEKEIKTAFRALAHKHHPDKGGDEKKFKEINEAYQTLSDSDKRAQYDRFGQSSNSFGGAGGFGQAHGWNMNYGNFARAAGGKQFTMPSFTRIPVLAWLLLLPIIVVVALIGLVVLFVWISFRTVQVARR